MANEPFVAQLAELCRAEPTSAKWVFVPSHALGHTLGDRLARDGHDWVNLRWVTPIDIAVRMAAPFLLERGLNPSEEQLSPALVMRLLLERAPGTGYFRPMAEHPSMAEALWRTIRELRYAGIRPDDLPSAAFASSAKHDELVALLSGYEHELARLRIADMPAVLHEAAAHPGWCPIAPDDVVLEAPGVLWSPLVRRFLDGLPGRRVAARVLPLPGADVHARADLLAGAREPVALEPATDAARLLYLRSPASAPLPRGDSSLALFHAGGADAEVAEVLRRVAALGESLDRVEVACASDEYAWLVWEQAQRLGWTVTVAAGIPVLRTRPGRLLLRYLEWLGGGFASADLRRLLQSGDCGAHALAAGVPGSTDETVPTPSQAARLLLKAHATWGRDTYAPALAGFAAVCEQASLDPRTKIDDREWPARKAAYTRTLAAWVSGVLEAIPQPDTRDTVAPADLAAASAGFLRATAGRASALDAMAAVAIDAVLTGLAEALGRHRSDMVSALAFIRASVDTLAIGRDRPRPGALHVSPLAEAGHDGRRHVFVTGLQEGGVFPAAIEDAVLLDDERRAISPLLRLSSDWLDESVGAVMARLAAIGQSASRVCLSFSCRDTRQFRDSFPSWMVLQACRLMRGDAALTYRDLASALGEPVSAVPSSPADALSDADWWLAAVARDGAARPRVLSAFPPLARGAAAGEARRSVTFTEFDGYVPAAGGVLDLSQAGRVISATSLESAAACPYRHFLKYGLGVRPLDESTSDPDAWLDPLTRGSELHDLFARIMRALRDEARSPDDTRDVPRLRAWGRERLDALRLAVPPPSDEVFVRESREFLDDLEAFMVSECEGRHGRDPVGFEVAFGYPAAETNGEPLASAEGLVLDLGHGRTLVLHGWIDRINRLGPGEYEVVDYKTGGYFGDDWKGSLAGGTRLQHAIYGHAAVRGLSASDRQARVSRGTYIFPSVKGHRHAKVIAAPSKAALVEVLRDVADVIRTGTFVSADSDRPCKFCDFTDACHPDAVDAAALKRDAPANTVLEPYRRLRSHE